MYLYTRAAQDESEEECMNQQDDVALAVANHNVKVANNTDRFSAAASMEHSEVIVVGLMLYKTDGATLSWCSSILNSQLAAPWSQNW